MSVRVLDSGVKPEYRTIQSEYDVAPRWRWIYDYKPIGLLLPREAEMDVAVIDPLDQLSAGVSLAGDAAFVHSRHGKAVDVSSATADTKIDLGVIDPIQDGSLTMIFAGTLNALPAGVGDWMQLASKRTNPFSSGCKWQWIINENNGASARQMNFATGSSSGNSSTRSAVPSVGFHVWAVRDNGITCEMWEDGLLMPSGDNSSVDIQVDPASNVQIGNFDGGSEFFDGSCSCFWFFGIPVPRRRIRMLSWEPWKPFVEERRTIVAMIPGAITPGAMSLYRRQRSR